MARRNSWTRVWGGRDEAFTEEARGMAEYLIRLDRGQIDLDIAATPMQGHAWIGAPTEESVPGDGSGRIRLRTSGTTGKPKIVERSFAAQRRVTRDESARWLLTYQPTRWAGISVISHALRSGGRLIVAGSRDSSAIVRSAIDEKATHVSMTPTFFKASLLHGDSAAWSRVPLIQVTFGGESATQDVIDRARQLWPRARISHVLASSEHGDICSASDGLAGYPISSLLTENRDLVDGELHIGGQPTGDLFELKEGRAFFAGRRDSIFNVGGLGVSPWDVETAAYQLAQIEFAHAYGVAHSLLGSVVGLDYVGSITPQALKSELRPLLPKHAWPARLRQLDHIPLLPTGKAGRAAAV